eukprot:TRINITY_DN66043_c0_g1_i1.p1 TRINITY_DN66043_c0_g1~~TRINITY_DN66043_c0_g1_i1.p1  ORF type:complete len:254 (+),score=56.98 TRINITY_DN66043_c0_g1_i1:100-861(+)
MAHSGAGDAPDHPGRPSVPFAGLRGGGDAAAAVAARDSPGRAAAPRPSEESPSTASPSPPPGVPYGRRQAWERLWPAPAPQRAGARLLQQAFPRASRLLGLMGWDNGGTIWKGDDAAPLLDPWPVVIEQEVDELGWGRWWTLLVLCPSALSGRLAWQRHRQKHPLLTGIWLLGNSGTGVVRTGLQVYSRGLKSYLITHTLLCAFGMLWCTVQGVLGAILPDCVVRYALLPLQLLHSIIEGPVWTYSAITRGFQ